MSNPLPKKVPGEILNRYLLFTVLVLLLGYTAGAQKNFVKGIIRDTAANKNLHYAIASLVNLSDSTLYKAIRSNEMGEFTFNKIPPGRYNLVVSYPRLADYLQAFTITDTTELTLGKIVMVTPAVLLEEVIMRSGVPIRMRGDTLEYTADSFVVRAGANVEELLKRLPGIQVDNDGIITAQGKKVEKILVDGDEFFSDDPGLASKYLHADAIDKVQVFDQKSETANFTGIDDGTRTKTMNLKLKKNKKNGSFGKLAAGSNGNEYYNHEAMGALFNGAKKISVFGLSSRTGKVGLAYNELNKYVGQDYELIEDGSNSYTINNEYESENYYGNGIPSVLSGGAHYSNKWQGGKQKLFSNYRVKEINAAGWSNSRSSTLLPDGSAFFNQSDNEEKSRSFSQKLGANFTLPLDSFSTIKITVSGNQSNNSNSNNGRFASRNEKNILVNNGNQKNSSLGENNKFSSNISYQHKFRKDGRTLSLLAQQDYTEGNTDNYNYSDNQFFNAATGSFSKADTLDQLQQSRQLNQSVAAKLNVTEKIADKLRLSLEYGYKTVKTGNQFQTFNNDNGKYTSLLDSLSNDYDFTINTHITGATLGWMGKKMNLTLGSKLFYTGFRQLNNDVKLETRRNFVNIAPQLNFRYTLKQNSQLSVNYSGQTFQPSVEQLQPLRRSSNPLYVQVGNPALAPGFRHNASVNYNHFNWQTGKNLSVNLSVNYTTNNIVSKVTTDAQNRSLFQYINLDGLPFYNAYAQYGWQYKKLHLRPSVMISMNKAGNNSILNNVIVTNQSFTGITNFSLAYDLKDKLTIAYTANFNFTKAVSNINNNQNRQTFAHSHSMKFTGYLSKTLTVATDGIFNFIPRNSTFNTSFNTIIWNASLEKKWLKNQELSLKLSANDLLNNNLGYRRNVYGNSIYESDRLTIKRYLLLTVGWNFSQSIK